MIKPVGMKWIALFLCAFVVWGCGSDNAEKEREERERQQKMKEAQALAEKIRKGDIFNEEAIIRDKLLRPEHICQMSADFMAIDFGRNPDFKADGSAAIFHEKSGVINYYYFPTRQYFKMSNNGRNPSFGKLMKSPADQKFIFEYYKLDKNSWEGRSYGILLNTEENWSKDPQLVTDIPAEEPFLVNDDKNVIYHIGPKYYMLDEKMNTKEITKEEYERLKNSRYVLENQWKVTNTYRDIPGVWITDLQEKNWCLLRNIEHIETLKIIPQTYGIYCWSPDRAGICMLRPVDINQYSIRLPEGMTAKVGDLFDIYEKKISPISHEVIGYDKSKYKGTLRVIEVLKNTLICEYQTKMYLIGIFKDDGAVMQGHPEIEGRIL